MQPIEAAEGQMTASAPIPNALRYRAGTPLQKAFVIIPAHKEIAPSELSLNFIYSKNFYYICHSRHTQKIYGIGRIVPV